MSSHKFRTYIVCVLLLTSTFSKAQKTIVISDSLASTAEKQSVKMGGQGLGKIWKFHFGDYAVVSSKMGWTTSSTKGNFFNTKTENKSTQKFSFLMAGKGPDTANVNAARNIMVQSLNEIELLPHFSWGSNEVKQSSDNFSAFITINGDTSEVWALLMNITSGQNANGSYDAFLTNVERKIFLVPASSNKNGGDNHSSPALGYEFIENGQSIGALQYYGGGMMGMNKNIVWIQKDLSDKMKLILASAMTALLQIKAVPQ
ncbi:MAG: hypothetical protein ACJ75B_02600 [Flavisolibacter sp.]